MATDTAARPRYGGSARALGGAYLILTIAALWPIFSVEVLPLVDYPNHLARMRILADLADSPELQAIYGLDWSVMPNLAMDLIVPALAKVFGLILAGQIFVAAALALLVAGTAALHRVLFGRVGPWPLVIYLFLYNYVLGFGFLNFLFGTGVYLLCFALWIRSQAWPGAARLAVMSLCAFLLFVCHLGAFGAYGLTVACHELWRLRAAPPGGLAALARRVTAAGAQFLVPLAVLLIARPPVMSEGLLGYELVTKITALMALFTVYHQPLDIMIGVFSLAALLLLLRRGWIAVAPAVVFPLIGLSLSVVVMPSWLMGNWANDFRLMVPLLCLFVAGSELRVPCPRPLLLLVVTALGLFAARIVTLSLDWAHYDRLFAELRGAARVLDSGARVLPAVDNWQGVARIAPNPYGRVFYNLPALLALERPVFVPTLFTAPGRQPLSVAPHLAAIDVPHGKPMTVARLRLGATADGADRLFATRRTGDYSYRWAGWPRRFDYVLMLDFGQPNNPLPELLSPVHGGSYFTIYSVRAAGMTAPQS